MSTSELYAVAYVVIPMGTPTTSVGEYIAECQRVCESMEAEGLRHQGPISVVWRALQRCHEAVHAMGVERIATDIRLGTRTDKAAGAQDPTHWSHGLSENERKRQSVVRRLAGESA